MIEEKTQEVKERVVFLYASAKYTPAPLVEAIKFLKTQDSNEYEAPVSLGVIATADPDLPTDLIKVVFLAIRRFD